MPAYQDLDAFKACHQLALAVSRANATLQERDPELAGRLWSTAIVASSGIARGSGFRNRRASAACVDRTAAALAEFGACLELAREVEAVSAEDHRELESLVGRALFYVMKLAMSLERTETPESGAPPGAAAREEPGSS